MDKKIYNKPEMKTVLLKYRTALLDSSDVESQGEGGSNPGSGARRFNFDEE